MNKASFLFQFQEYVSVKDFSLNTGTQTLTETRESRDQDYVNNLQFSTMTKTQNRESVDEDFSSGAGFHAMQIFETANMGTSTGTRTQEQRDSDIGNNYKIFHVDNDISSYK